MQTKKTNIIFKILNIWLSFTALLMIASTLPHWPNVIFMCFINESLYFLVLILTLAIIRKDSNNRDIFINISLFIFSVVIGFLKIFFGDTGIVGNIYHSYYLTIFISFLRLYLLTFSIAYITFKYLFPKTKIWTRYLTISTITTAVFFFHFFPYLHDPNYMFTLGDQLFIDLYTRQIWTYLLSLGLIGLYGYHLYRYDRSLGEYINAFMAFLMVFLFVDVIHNISYIYHFHMFPFYQFILTVHLCFLSYILFKRLLYLNTEYGQFYESLIHQKVSLGKVRIQRRQSKQHVLVMQVLKIYFSQRRYFFLAAGGLLAVCLIYFRVPKYIALYLIGFLFCTAVLIIYISRLYQRRARKNYTLP